MITSLERPSSVTKISEYQKHWSAVVNSNFGSPVCVFSAKIHVSNEGQDFLTPSWKFSIDRHIKSSNCTTLGQYWSIFFDRTLLTVWFTRCLCKRSASKSKKKIISEVLNINESELPLGLNNGSLPLLWHRCQILSGWCNFIIKNLIVSQLPTVSFQLTLQHFSQIIVLFFSFLLAPRAIFAIFFHFTIIESIGNRMFVRLLISGTYSLHKISVGGSHW